MVTGDGGCAGIESEKKTNTQQVKRGGERGEVGWRRRGEER